MRLILVLYFVFSVCGTVLSQALFNNAYEIGGLVHGATSALEEDNGNFMVLGQEVTPGYRAMAFIKLLPNGDTIWTKSYPRAQYAYYTGLSNSLRSSSDTNFVFAGSVVNLLDTSNTSDALLVKFNGNGDTIWTKTYGGPAFDNAVTSGNTTDNGYVLFGTTTSFGAGRNDLYLIKTNSAGDPVWQKTFGSTLNEMTLSGQTTLDGGYIITGQQGSVFYAVKTDSLGGIDWQQTYPGTKGGCYVRQTADSDMC